MVSDANHKIGLPTLNSTEEIGTNKIKFCRLGRRVIEGCFDGGSMTSEAGVMLLGEIAYKLRLFDAASRCMADRRDPLLIKHTVQGMLRQRVYEMASLRMRCANCGSLEVHTTRLASKIFLSFYR